MSNTESEEASNDAAIISELFNSAEAIRNSSESTANINIKKTNLQQKCDFQIASNNSDVSSTICDATKQNLIVSLQQNYNSESDDFFNSAQFSGMENLNNMHIRHVHIPYILNGELYQIQTQDGENVTVKCCHCPPDRVYRGSVRSTGNFHMHIKRRHPDLLEKLHNMKVNALLERRDRLLRNRKISNRNNRFRLNSSNNNINAISLLKNEEKSGLSSRNSTTLDPVTESNILHTHKLKIKTVFQRHQMQQREAEEMRKWNNTEYVVMPIGKITANSESEQPINFCVKPQYKSDTTNEFSSNSSSSQQIQKLSEQRSPQDITTQNKLENITNLANQSTHLSNCNNELNESICESHLNLITSSPSCPSAVSSSFSSSHQYEVEAHRLYNCYSFHHQNVSIIKPEQTVLRTETEAIDLTMQTDSGIFSSSEDNDFENNKSDSSINEVRAAPQNSTERINKSENSNNIKTAKWHELLMQVENSLRDIQREMNVRNQIESNRVFLDIAKFKFLNPGFQFNW